jgi:hypothetical protein
MIYDVAILGGGLSGAMAALQLQRQGLSSCILESRPWGKEQKVVVGEAITEGSSVFLRHELGLGEWLQKNAFRKFGFDFLIRPRHGGLPATMEECHELLLSLTPLEKNPRAFTKLIPTFHVERTSMNRHLAAQAKAAGAHFLDGASVEQVSLGAPHEIHYARAQASLKRCARTGSSMPAGGARYWEDSWESFALSRISILQRYGIDFQTSIMIPSFGAHSTASIAGATPSISAGPASGSGGSISAAISPPSAFPMTTSSIGRMSRRTIAAFGK